MTQSSTMRKTLLALVPVVALSAALMVAFAGPPAEPNNDERLMFDNVQLEQKQHFSFKPRLLEGTEIVAWHFIEFWVDDKTKYHAKIFLLGVNPNKVASVAGRNLPPKMFGSGFEIEDYGDARFMPDYVVRKGVTRIPGSSTFMVPFGDVNYRVKTTSR